MLKNDFGFPNVNWLHLTGEMDKSVKFHVEFSQNLTYHKSLKSLKRSRFFWNTVYDSCMVSYFYAYFIYSALTM